VDIRTKLVFALVLVALMSIFAKGAVVATQVDGIVRDSRLEQLDELAESRKQALLWIVEGWRDRTDLIADRTPLRTSLADRSATGSALAASRVQAVLDDAVAAAQSPSLVTVYDVEGVLVASARGRRGEPMLSHLLAEAPEPPESTRYVGIEFDSAGAADVTFVAPVTWNERAVGSVAATYDVHEVVELTSSYMGLGETGEAVVFAEDPEGVPRVLHPLRHDADGRFGVPLPAGPGSLVAHAEMAQPASDGLTDERGVTVWAATERVDDTGWGVVVKVDAAEEQQRYTDFRRQLRKTALILAAFAILAGFGFGMRVALPIHALAEVANRIRSGDMKARAKVVVEDEVGALTRSFNEMADELEERMDQLHVFQKFFDNSIDLMCIASTDGYFKRVNPAFLRVLGWSEEEFLTRSFLSFIHPDDVDKTVNEVGKLRQGIPTISFENRYQRKDGTYVLLRWTSYPEHGRLYAIAHVLDESLPG